MIDLAARYGCTVEGSGRHLKILHPDGWRVASAPSTPSDWRTLKNTERDIKRGLREGNKESCR